MGNSKSKWYKPPRGRLRLHLEFVWQDMWIGIFYRLVDYDEPTTRDFTPLKVHTFYICFIPMLPIIFEVKVKGHFR